MENDAVKLVFVSLLAAALYLIPWIIAARRDHHRRALISTVNVLLGWTVVGWGVALYWALSPTEGRTELAHRRLQRAAAVNSPARRDADVEEHPAFRDARPS